MNHKTYISRNLHKKNSFKRCMSCGKETIKAINLAGRTVLYKNYEISIPDDYQVIVLGCTDHECGNYILGPNDCEMLDTICENIIEHDSEYIKVSNE